MGLSAISLFSGAGGLDLAAKRCGIRTVCYVEWDRYSQASLMSSIRAGRLDDSPIWDDVSTFSGGGGVEKWIASLVGSHARICQSPESGLGSSKALEAGFGGSMPESWAKWDRGSSSWKTSQVCLLTGLLESFWGTWPEWGLMLSGGVSQPPHLEPIFSESAFSFVRGSLIPSPVAVDGKGSGRIRPERGANNNLRDYFNVNGGWMCPPVQVVEYLMGWPTNHTALDSAATAWFQTKQSRRSKKSSK